MVFPPGKDYDMVIMADGYKPYVINIYLPNQTYFYENFQEIYLRPIVVNSLGETIGEEIKVSNIFYDIHGSVHSRDSVSALKYNRLLNKVMVLIETTDTLGLVNMSDNALFIEEDSEANRVRPQADYNKLFSLVEDAINTTDSASLNIIEKKSIPNYSYENSFFYGPKENANQELVNLSLEGDTIKGINVRASKLLRKEPIDSLLLEDSSCCKKVTEFSISFDKNSNDIKHKYIKQLNELALLLKTNSELYVEILGFAHQNEDSQAAVQRAFAVRSFFTDANLDIKKTKSFAFYAPNCKQEKIQKANIKIFEYKNKLYKKTRFISAIKLEAYDPEDCESVEDVIYKVQIISGGNKLLLNDDVFKGETVNIYTHNGLYKYTVGSYATKKQADLECANLKRKGFAGAFVVGFIKGKRLE